MKIWVFIVGVLFSYTAHGQHVMGKVVDPDGKNLVGATVVWQGTTQGTTTGDDGWFHLDKNGVKSNHLIVSFVGFQSDTILGEGRDIEVVLYQSGRLKEAVIKKKQAGVIISDLSSIKKEIITGTELKKAACCDLAGAFSTQASVKAQTTNVLTNSKELRINGLSGVYNQVLIEGFPLIQGLTYTYGISSIPGTLVKNIFISKGSNSVLQGYEAITGQVNVITLDPACADKYLINGFLNSFGESQLNFNINTKKGDWSNIISGHVTQPAQKIDRDDDGFMDLPQMERYNLWTRWKYKEEDKFGWSTRIALRGMYETRLGGQVKYDPELHRRGTEYYGQEVDIQQVDMFAKTAYRFSEDARLVFFNSLTGQNQNSWYGRTNYDAEQVYWYNNVQFEQDWKETNTVKTGLSYRHFNLTEYLHQDGTESNRPYTNKRERVIGAFAENEANFYSNRLTMLTGARLDHHNTHGFMATPRMLLRFKANTKTTLRFNAGKGWRTANILSENIRMLISSRSIVADELRPEEAWNFGFSATRKYNRKDIQGYVTLDLAFTDFVNQIVPIYVSESNRPEIYVGNFATTSSQSAQLEGYLNLKERYEFKAAYNYLDVYRYVAGQKTALPFNNKHRFLGTFSWNPKHDKFHLDLNMHWFGPQSMPNTANNPEEFQRPSFSDAYQTFAGQFTYNFKKWEWYVGCENIFDFRQKRPIISWEDPFGDYFDTSSVWGPTRGREMHIGFRYYPGK